MLIQESEPASVQQQKERVRGKLAKPVRQREGNLEDETERYNTAHGGEAHELRLFLLVSAARESVSRAWTRRVRRVQANDHPTRLAKGGLYTLRETLFVHTVPLARSAVDTSPPPGAVLELDRTCSL